MLKVPYPSPGEILLEEFLKPMGITQYRLAKSFLIFCFDKSKQIGVSQRRISEIIAGTRAITVDTGLRLATFFGMSEGFWVGLQIDYDAAQIKEKLAAVLAKIRPWIGNADVNAVA